MDDKNKVVSLDLVDLHITSRNSEICVRAVMTDEIMRVWVQRVAEILKYVKWVLFGLSGLQYCP